MAGMGIGEMGRPEGSLKISARHGNDFFNKVAGPARKAEEQYGVPAAGLVGMAMLESGYGFTRTAQLANNLFGWKAPASESMSYLLTCQPASDPGNHYRRFADWGEAVDAVGRKLGMGATRKQSASATRNYAHDRAMGMPITEAALAVADLGITLVDFDADLALRRAD